MSTAGADCYASRTPAAHHIAVALAACVIATLPAVFMPPEFGEIAPLAPIGLAILPLAVLFATGQAFILCLAFVIFSFFRIHEAFPVLNPLRIPQILALSTLGVLVWQIGLKKSIQMYWSRELTWFASFFVLVTLGIVFAVNKPTAFGYWTATYSKIAIMTVAIAWLTRTKKDFSAAAHAFVLAGMAIAYVTISNKLNGIGLVEGTRVTIGRDIRSVLGDPNDLSLVLLFPLSFAVALVVKRSSPLSAEFGFCAVCMLIYAIIATQSRGGLLGLVTVIGIAGSRVIKSKTVLASIGALGLVLLFAAAGISGRSSGGAAESGIDESSMGRIYAWGAAWNMAVARPLTGVGLDNFVANYFFYSSHWDGLNHAVHSTWFNVIGEAGFPGIITFLTMIGVTATCAYRAAASLEKQEHAPPAAKAMALAVLAGIGGFCVSGTFLTQAFTWPIYVLIALTTAVSRFASRNEAELQDAKSAQK